MRSILSPLTRPRAVRIARLLIGLIFAAAALAKLGDLSSFAEQVHNFRLLPVAAENLAAMTLPWIELLAALALIFDVRARAGAWVVFILLGVFTVAVATAMARGLDFECGCFGTTDSTRVGTFKLAENLAMLVLARVAGLRAR
jgi:putative oxidoreductase